MYTLRRVSGQGIQMNFALGKSYTFIGRFESYNHFTHHFFKYFSKQHVADLDPTSDEDTRQVYAFVSNEDGSEEHVLYMNQRNYIMTESGSTFSNLTFKN